MGKKFYCVIHCGLLIEFIYYERVCNFFLFVDDRDLKTEEKEKTFDKEWLEFVSILLVFKFLNSYLLNHRERIHEGKYRVWHLMWLVALLTCE